MKKIAIIGSTGSIGKQTLAVIKRNPQDFTVVSLAGGTNTRVFLEQVKEFKPKVATLVNAVDTTAYPQTEFSFGEDAFTNAITPDADIVVIALVGFKGVLAVLDAIEKGKTIALANKESLVVGGELVMQKAKEKGVKILPVDSEHSAVWQSLDYDTEKPFNKIILTCSGGAFRNQPKENFKNLTEKDALLHPNWAMGDKITIDCATLVNKGFEVIEAKWLFNTDFDKIDVIIHRESIIHSMVEYTDGSVVAQLGAPTMETPISVALYYPHREKCLQNKLDFTKLKDLTFAEYDERRFPCLKLVIETGKKGGILPAVLNGANEVVVKAFLDGEITYDKIYPVLNGAVERVTDNFTPTCVEHLINADALGRKKAQELIEGINAN